VHDSEVFRQSGLAEIIDLGDTIGDKGYVGLGIHTPIKKPIGGELTEQQKGENSVINSLRAAIERAIAHMKAWRVLHTDYRRPLHTFSDTLDAVVGLIFSKPLLNKLHDVHQARCAGPTEGARRRARERPTRPRYPERLPARSTRG
jgi:hypothetical protein